MEKYQAEDAPMYPIGLHNRILDSMVQGGMIMDEDGVQSCLMIGMKFWHDHDEHGECLDDDPTYGVLELDHAERLAEDMLEIVREMREHDLG